ncbi:MAG TPA: hypothetical protein VFH39_03925 [Candidatus Saccharimonadales bacterium]|jgi:hypothetical protein|nr:hypothetical protein [Candidatus Saccharimonadales bacterium]
MSPEVPSAANFYPHTPEKELVELLLSKKIAASSIDEDIYKRRAAEGREGWGLEHRPYVIPKEQNESLPCDCDQMRFEPRKDVSFGTSEIFAWIPRSGESNLVFFNDVFIKVCYADGHPEELYLLNGEGLVTYRQATDLQDNMDDVARGGYMLDGDRFSVVNTGPAGRLTAEELRIVLEPAITLTQDPIAG